MYQYQQYNYGKKVTKVIERHYDEEGRLTKEVETHYEDQQYYPYQTPYIYTTGGAIKTY